MPAINMIHACTSSRCHELTCHGCKGDNKNNLSHSRWGHGWFCWWSGLCFLQFSMYHLSINEIAELLCTSLVNVMSSIPSSTLNHFTFPSCINTMLPALHIQVCCTIKDFHSDNTVLRAKRRQNLVNCLLCVLRKQCSTRF